MSTHDRRAEAASLPAASPADAAPPASALRRVLRRLRPLAIVLGLVATLLGLNWYLAVGRYMESTDNATIAGDIAVLSARIDGHIAEILVADNQPVVAGQPLLRLADRTWRARLDEAEAEVAAARASVVTADRQVTQQHSVVAQAAAAIEQARAEAVRARADATRAGSLVGGGWTSRQALDRAEAETRKADAGVTAAEAALAAARAQTLVLEAQAAQARAAQARAEATAEVARANLDNAVVRAPFDGQVGNRAAQLGQFVRPGQGLIAVAPAASGLFVLANFKETQLSRMRPGQPVSISVDALGGTTLKGRVESLSPATGALFSLLPPENATGNFTKIVQRVPVRIALDEPERAALLRPGLSVVPRVDTRDDPSRPASVLGAAAAQLSALAR